MSFFFGQRILEELEIQEYAAIEARNERIRALLEDDVKEHYTEHGFKKVMSKETRVDSESLLVDVAYQLIHMALDPNLRVGECNPRLGKEMEQSQGKSLHQIKSGTYIFDLLCFALTQCDRDQFMKFRKGELTLSQLVSRVEEVRTGMKYNVLDDLIDVLHPSLLKHPDKHMMKAFYEREREKKLLKSALRRGIDPQVLKNTARNFDIAKRCTKSMFS